MFKQSKLDYYFHTLWLRFWAYYYFIYDKINPKAKENKKMEILSNWNKNQTTFKYTLTEENSFFYTYSFFPTRQFLLPFLVKNEDGFYTSYKGYPPTLFMPLILGYYGLVTYNHYFQTQDEMLKKEIYNYANYTISKMELTGALNYNYDYKLFNQKAPWHSGIAQAIISSFLLRAHLLYPNENFLMYSQKAMDFMLHEGKLNTETPEGFLWIEEYPMESHSMVLNGFIFSIISIIEVDSMIASDKYSNLAQAYLQSLINYLHLYLFPKGIRHNMKQIKFGNANYEALHVFLFFHLYKLTNNLFFYNIALKYFKMTNWKVFYALYNIKYNAELKGLLESYFKNL